MDTLAFTTKQNKYLNLTIGIGLTLTILLFQNLYISAKDKEFIFTTGLSPSINNLKVINDIEESEFKNDIKDKYKNATITEIEKGISHVRMIRYYNNRPVRLNIIEVSTDINKNLKIEPVIASKTLSAKSKISTMAKQKDAIIAINGGYFKPQNGIPLGTLMINKKIYTGPIYDRVGIGFFDNGYSMARIKLDVIVDTNIGGFKIDNVNQPRMLSTHSIVYTRDWGKTTPQTPKYGVQLVVSNGKFVGLTTQSTEIPENGFVVVGPIKTLEKISKAKNLKLKIKTNPEWENVNHIISGGPYLVKDSEIFVDMTAQKLTAIGGRNPRTAIGFTKDNNLILLTADGRESSSIGLTLFELANLMREFGCINAMNLDGGGSSVMYVDGAIVNHPAVRGGIPLSHSLVISKTKS